MSKSDEAIANMKPDDVNRFWDKVQRHPGPCWLWTSACNSNGYGLFTITRPVQKTPRAHRIAWFLEHGYLPQKPLLLAHTCMNKICVRPSHLEETTELVNHQYPDQAKLTPEQVADIKAALSAGATGAGLARTYRVNPESINAIRRGDSWANITGSPSPQRRLFE